MTLSETTVYGERIARLLPGLFALRDSMTIDTEGRYEFSVSLEPEVGLPLRRAIMRVEAELLREDADSLGSEGEIDRTYEQRAADALLRLMRAVGNTARS